MTIESQNPLAAQTVETPQQETTANMEGMRIFYKKQVSEILQTAEELSGVPIDSLSPEQQVEVQKEASVVTKRLLSIGKILVGAGIMAAAVYEIIQTAAGKSPYGALISAGEMTSGLAITLNGINDLLPDKKPKAAIA